MLASAALQLLISAAN